jgi:nucleotide-binding universal stress UspA family protein
MKVLLAIDGSSHSDAAVAQVARQLWPKGTEVEVLTVVHAAIPLFTEPTLVIVAAHEEQAEDLRKLAPKLVVTARERIRAGAPEVTVTTKIVEGRPKDMIVIEAIEWNADLIVVGSHGYGRAKRMLLGSVAGAVVANAPCSVQVVRTKREAMKRISAAASGPAA